MAVRDSKGRYAKKGSSGGSSGGGASGGGGQQVASLFGLLGLKLDRGAWDEGTAKIAGLKSAILGAAAFFGGQFLGKSLIGFNANVEESRNQIAGMLALTKKTDLNKQLSVADTLYANLQRRAATLPGTTQEYVQMLGMLTQPVTAAGLGVKDLEDITVNAVVAAKALGVAWDVGARDIDQALRGQFHATDQLTGKLLATMGYVGEEGRRKFNAMTAAQRAAKIQASLTQKQITQLAEAQGKTFEGRLSTLQDAAEQFLGRVGKSLFAALGTTLEKVADWIDENKEAIAEVADDIGRGLASAFHSLGRAIVWISEHGDLLRSVLIALGIVFTAVAIDAAIAWLAVAWPILAVVAALTLVAYVVQDVIRYFTTGQSKILKAWTGLSSKLRSTIKVIATILYAPFAMVFRQVYAVFESLVALPGRVKNAFSSIGGFIKEALAAAFEALGNLPVVKQMLWLAQKIGSLIGLKDIGDGFSFENERLLQDVSEHGLPAGADQDQDFREMMQRFRETSSPSRPAAGGNGPVSFAPQTNIKIEGITDPNAVASTVRRHIDDFWGEQLRQIEDVT